MANKFKDELDEEFEQHQKPKMTYKEAVAYTKQDSEKRWAWKKKCMELRWRVKKGEVVEEFMPYQGKPYWANPYNYDLPYTKEEMEKLNEAAIVIKEKEDKKKLFPY